LPLLDKEMTRKAGENYPKAATTRITQDTSIMEKEFIQ
jgi:hypothetical protein